MQYYRGSPKQGPFAKMMEVCNQLRWTIDVPLIADPDGVWHNWLEMNEKTLYELVKEAWVWHICREVQHRKDLADIDGIDHRVMLQARNKIKPHLLGLIFRLQDGTFVEPAQHAKYDTGKDSTCLQCGGQDSVEHRCTTCPARNSIYSKHAQILQKWGSFSRAKKIHLLPPHNPHWIKFKELAGQAEDHVKRWKKQPEPEQCHLFTDGSCHGNRHRMYHLASWAVVSASGDYCVASGSLGGLGQDSDRAELRAVIAAVNYALEVQRDTTIWTDSTFAAEGMVRLLHDIKDVPEGNYENDWIELQGLLCQRDVMLQVQHVPGHCQWIHQEVDFQNWAARWNDRADREANMAMKLHGPHLLALHRHLCAHHEGELADLCALQELHLDIMDKAKLDQIDEGSPELDGDEDSRDLRVERGCPDSLPVFRGLPVNFRELLAPLYESYGCSFVDNFVQVLKDWETDSNAVFYKVSFLELAVYLAVEGKPWIPMPHSSKPGCWLDKDTFNYHEPNLGALVRLAKSFIKELDRCFSLGVSWCKGISLAHFGVYTPLDGLILAVNAGVADTILCRLRGFTRRRPVRQANDLARPMRT
jgi:ribonuclease HI